MKNKTIILLFLLTILSACINLPFKRDVNEFRITPEPWDGKVEANELQHIPNNIRYTVEKKDNIVRFIIQTAKNDIMKAFIVYNKEREIEEEMKKFNSSDFSNLYYVDIKLKNNKINYYFKLLTGDKDYYLGKTRGFAKKDLLPFEYTYNKKAKEVIPNWARKAIWYQIFINRFNNGDKTNDPIYNEWGPEIFKAPTNKKTKTKSKKANYINENKWEIAENNFGEFKTNSWKSNWQAKLPWEKAADKKGIKNIKNTRMYGGDLQGIIKKLDYIKDLGVDSLWLSPVFYSNSNHKYNIMDRRHISPDFGVIIQKGDKKGAKVYSQKGSSELKLFESKKGINALKETENKSTWVWTESDLKFIDLIKKAHKMGIHIMVDMPLSFQSSNSWTFKDVLINGKNSKYILWYKINGWDKEIEYTGKSKIGIYNKNNKTYRKAWISTPESANEKDKYEILLWNKNNLDYKGHNGNKELPLINFENKDAKNYIINTTKKWIFGFDGKVEKDFTKDDGIDGIKIEYIDEINKTKFIQDFINEIKKEKPSFFLSSEKLSYKDMEKSEIPFSISYDLADILIKYILNSSSIYKIKAVEAKNLMEKLDINTPYYLSQGRLNILDSNNTDRAFSMTINPNREYGVKNINSKDSKYKSIRPDIFYSGSVDRLKMLAAVNMTFLGSPVIYYGTEVGMWGANDPENRKPMIWIQNKENKKNTDDKKIEKKIKNTKAPKNLKKEDKDKVEKLKKLQEVKDLSKRINGSLKDIKNPKKIKEYNDETDKLHKYKKEGQKAVHFDGKLDLSETEDMITYKVNKNEEVEDFYKKLIKIRNDYKNLFSFGDIKYTYFDNSKDILVFTRTYKEKSAIIVINNRNSSQQLELPFEKTGYYKDMITGKEYQMVKDKFKMTANGSNVAIIIKE